MKKDWNGAFHYLEEYSKINFDDYDYREYFSDCEANAIKARLHYKMGKKSLAFIEYCELTASINPKQDTEIIKFRYSLCQSDLYHYINYSMSCFPTYSSFLEFMEDEYANVDNPEKYSVAMNVYRSLNE